jgi:hypothetical protein
MLGTASRLQVRCWRVIHSVTYPPIRQACRVDVVGGEQFGEPVIDVAEDVGLAEVDVLGWMMWLARAYSTG